MQAMTGELWPQTCITDTFLATINGILDNTTAIMFLTVQYINTLSSHPEDREWYRSYNMLKEEAFPHHHRKNDLHCATCVQAKQRGLLAYPHLRLEIMHALKFWAARARYVHVSYPLLCSALKL